MPTSQDLVRRLVTDFADLQPVMDEHLADQDWLEYEFMIAEPAEKDLIGLGFVEAIPFPPEGAALLVRLGPALTGVAGELGIPPRRLAPRTPQQRREG